jgi:plasmid maintenance system antidote protein VapI
MILHRRRALQRGRQAGPDAAALAALLDQVDAARQALVRGAEAIAAEVARRLMA